MDDEIYNKLMAEYNGMREEQAKTDMEVYLMNEYLAQ